MNHRTVIDANVAVKWFTLEEHRAHAVKLRDAHIAGETKLTAPLLLAYEVTNALRYNAALTASDLEEAVNALHRIGIELVPPTPESMAQAAVEARCLNITVYDASYLVLSRGLDTPLVTADDRLTDKAAEYKVTRLETL